MLAEKTNQKTLQQEVGGGERKEEQEMGRRREGEMGEEDGEDG